MASKIFFPIRKCIFGFQLLTTGPSYLTKCTLCTVEPWYIAAPSNSKLHTVGGLGRYVGGRPCGSFVSSAAVLKACSEWYLHSQNTRLNLGHGNKHVMPGSWWGWLRFGIPLFHFYYFPTNIPPDSVLIFIGTWDFGLVLHHQQQRLLKPLKAR